MKKWILTVRDPARHHHQQSKIHKKTENKNNDERGKADVREEWTVEWTKHFFFSFFFVVVFVSQIGYFHCRPNLLGSTKQKPGKRRKKVTENQIWDGDVRALI